MTFTQLVEQAMAFPAFLYHGTAEDLYVGIRETGMNAHSFWSPDVEVARYFSEEENSGGASIVLQLPFGAFDTTAFAPDQAMWQEPVDPVADYWDLEYMSAAEQDEIIYDKWQSTNGTWEASLHVLRSVIYNKPLPPEVMMMAKVS
jgi:hypothetical protein